MRAYVVSALLALSSPAIAEKVNDETAANDQLNAREIEWMNAAVRRLKMSLVDPDSARISLPHGFTPRLSTWKIWGANMTGYFTCGTVNSRNRMGGYVGETVFLAQIDQNGEVSTTTDSAKYPLLGKICAAGGLPPIRPTTIAALTKKAPVAGDASLAKQLADLAKLHQDGAITSDEFAAAKARIIASK